MTLPFESLTGSLSEVGLVVATVIGIGFGTALERAGFGRLTKLAAQFYFTDMTVFKVMFGAIVTAMLGLVVAGAFGVVDLAALSTSAASPTFLWPMAVGGFGLGVGFIISGYCPGTSLVAAASGKLDGFATIGGVVIGSVIYAEVEPLLGGFPTSGAEGHLFLYDWLGVSPAVLAVGIALIAMGLFLGAEHVEALMARRSASPRVTDELDPASTRHGPVFGLYAAAGAVAIAAAMLIPTDSSAADADAVQIEADQLAERVLAEPWTVRVVDVRDREACAAQRVPASECVPLEELDSLGLEFSAGTRDLVLVGDDTLDPVPSDALGFPGRVLVLRGGFDAWSDYALQAPPLPDPDATAEQRADYQLRAGINKALTGVAPPPPPPVQGFSAPAKKEGGGCN